MSDPYLSLGAPLIDLGTLSQRFRPIGVGIVLTCTPQSGCAMRAGKYASDADSLGSSRVQPRRTAKNVLTAMIQEAYAQGITTRSVDDLVKALEVTGVSKSPVRSIGWWGRCATPNGRGDQLAQL